VSPAGGTPRKGSEHADFMDFSMLGVWETGGQAWRSEGWGDFNSLSNKKVGKL